MGINKYGGMKMDCFECKKQISRNELHYHIPTKEHFDEDGNLIITYRILCAKCKSRMEGS